MTDTRDALLAACKDDPDDDLAALAGASRLEALSIARTILPPGCLRPLFALPLRVLDIYGAQIPKGDLASFQAARPDVLLLQRY